MRRALSRTNNLYISLSIVDCVRSVWQRDFPKTDGESWKTRFNWIPSLASAKKKKLFKVERSWNHVSMFRVSRWIFQGWLLSTLFWSIKNRPHRKNDIYFFDFRSRTVSPSTKTFCKKRARDNSERKYRKQSSPLGRVDLLCGCWFNEIQLFSLYFPSTSEFFAQLVSLQTSTRTQTNTTEKLWWNANRWIISDATKLSCFDSTLSGNSWQPTGDKLHFKLFACFVTISMIYKVKVFG